MTIKRSLTKLLAITAIVFWHGLGIASAQMEADTPRLFSPHEHLPAADVSTLNRLRFLTSLDFPPFNSLDDNGRLRGYNIDLARALCDQMGVSDICQVEALPWQELQDKLVAGEGEAIIAGLQPNEQNRQSLLFSRPYLRLPARFVTKKANGFTGLAATALSGRQVGVISKSAHEQLLQRYFPSAIAVPYPDRETLLAAVENDKITAAFDDGMALSFWLNSDAARDCCTFSDGPYLAPQFLGTGLNIAISQANPRLKTAFDNALQALENKGVLTDLYQRYFPVSFY